VRLSPWRWARHTFPLRNVNAIVNRVSALLRGVGPPLEHLTHKENQARTRQAEERSCTFPGVDVPCSSLSTQPVLFPVTFPDYPAPH
jgi:hypothetical protein